ncbi:MAG: hypothetical protein ACRDX9_10800, partial [Acidimicrobiia bacterium]
HRHDVAWCAARATTRPGDAYSGNAVYDAVLVDNRQYAIWKRRVQEAEVGPGGVKEMINRLRG